MERFMERPGALPDRYSGTDGVPQARMWGVATPAPVAPDDVELALRAWRRILAADESGAVRAALGALLAAHCAPLLPRRRRRAAPTVDGCRPGRAALLAALGRTNGYELARRLSVSPSTLSRWAGGKVTPGHVGRLALAAELGIPLDVLW